MESTVTISGLLGPKPGDRIRLVGGNGGAALYISRTGPGTSKISVSNRMPYETLLLPVPNLVVAGVSLGSGDAWPTVIVPQWLPPAPDWCLAVASDGSLSGAIQSFGGGGNALLIGAAKNGTLNIPNILDQENYTQPRMLRGAPPATADQAYVCAIADGAVLNLFPPASELQPATGSRLMQAFAGVVLQDEPSSTDVWVVHLEGGPAAAILSANGAQLGRLSLTSFNRSLNAAGLTLPIVEQPVVGEFDVDKRDGVYCLLASTDAGAQLLLFDGSGGVSKPAWPADGLGDGHWLTSPTVLALAAASPGVNAAQSPAFLFAFIEMADDGPVGFRLGAVTPLSSG